MAKRKGHHNNVKENNEEIGKQEIDTTNQATENRGHDDSADEQLEELEELEEFGEFPLAGEEDDLELEPEEGIENDEDEDDINDLPVKRILKPRNLRLFEFASPAESQSQFWSHLREPVAPDHAEYLEKGSLSLLKKNNSKKTDVELVSEQIAKEVYVDASGLDVISTARIATYKQEVISRLKDNTENLLNLDNENVLRYFLDVLKVHPLLLQQFINMPTVVARNLLDKGPDSETSEGATAEASNSDDENDTAEVAKALTRLHRMMFAALNNRVNVVANTHSFNGKNIVRESAALHIVRELMEVLAVRAILRQMHVDFIQTKREKRLERLKAAQEKAQQQKRKEETYTKTKVDINDKDCNIKHNTNDCNGAISDVNAKTTATDKSEKFVCVDGSFEEVSCGDDEDEQEELFAHRGFTTPGILVLVPTRHCAWRMCSMIMSLIPGLTSRQIEGLRRWEEQYGPDPEDELQMCATGTDDGSSAEVGLKFLPDEVPAPVGEINITRKKVSETRVSEMKKQLDFNQEFCGNDDDDFIFGMKVGTARGPTAVKLMSGLSTSDIIFASPLGLCKFCNIKPYEFTRKNCNFFTINDENSASEIKEQEEVFDENGADNVDKDKKTESVATINRIEFLSSLHTVYVDSMEHLSQQNPHTLIAALWAINRRPTDRRLIDNYSIGELFDCFLQNEQRSRIQFITEGINMGDLMWRLFGLDVQPKKAIDAFGLPGTLARVLYLQNTPAQVLNQRGICVIATHNTVTVPEMLTLPLQSIISKLEEPCLTSSTTNIIVDIAHRVHSGDLRVVFQRLEPQLLLRKQRLLAEGDREVREILEQEPLLDYAVNVVLPTLLPPEQVARKESGIFTNDAEREAVYNEIREMDGLVIVLPSIYKYGKMVNLLSHARQYSGVWGALSENVTNDKLLTVLRKFADGEIKLLLTTERFFFYRRTPLHGKNMSTVLFLRPPEYTNIVYDLAHNLVVNTKDTVDHTKNIMVVYEPQNDSLRLLNIFSGRKSEIFQMVKAEKFTRVFVSDSVYQ